MRRLFFLIPILFLLSGCSTGIINIPSSEFVDSTGKIITKTAGTVGDASTYRTHEKYNAWNVANREYTNAVKASGFQMKFAMVDVGGTKLYLPKEISFRESPQFHAPAELHDHPVWHTLDNFVSVATPWGFGTWAATSIVSSMEHVANRPTNQYNGPVQNTGSYNSAGRDQYVTANGPKMDQGVRTDSPGCSNGNCAEPSKTDKTAGFNLADCEANPPGGYNANGDPLYDRNSGLSCESYQRELDAANLNGE